ncbi:MAG: ATP-binding protein [Ginsengibacter sp.]
MRIKKSGYFASIASFVTGIVALSVLIGWIIFNSAFKTGAPGIFSFKFHTSLCFLFSSVALFLLNKKRERSSELIIAHISIFLALILAGITFSEYIFKCDSGIDELLTNYNLTTNQYSAQMSFISSIVFILLNVSFLLLNYKRFHLFVQVLLMFGIVCLSFNLILVAAKLNYSKPNQFIAAALNVTALFLILYGGTLFSRKLIYLKFSFEKKIAGCFGLVLLVLVIIFVSIDKNNERAKIIEQKVEHGNQIIIKSQKILGLVLEMETSIMGYVISGKDVYLDSYNKLFPQVNEAITDLRTFTKQDSLTHLWADTLANIIASNITIRNQIIEERKTKGYEAAYDLFHTSLAQRKMNKLREMVNKIEDSKDQSVTNLEAEQVRSSLDTKRTILLFQIVIFSLLIIAFLVIYKNTRERNNAKEEIVKNNLFLETVLDNIPNMLFIKNAGDLTFLRFNKAGENLLGTSREVLIGKNDYALFSKEQADEYVSRDWKVLGQKEVIDFPEEKLATKFGDRWLHTRKLPVFDSNGKPIYLLGISVDITEKKIAADQLKKATEEIYDLYNHAPCGYHSTDADGRFVEINNTELKWYGYRRSEIIGKMKFFDLLTIESKEGYECHYTELKKNGFLRDVKFEVIRKDGSIFPVMLNSSAIYDAKGKFFRSRSIITDYTDRKKLDDQIKKFNQELEIRVEEQTAALKSSNTDLERFAYVASHDLQEPLRMVSSFLHLLERRLGEDLDETNKKYIDFAVDGAERMKMLIQDLLEYSRLSSSLEVLKEVDSNLIIQNVLHLLDFDIQKENATVQIHPLPVIKARGPQIQQVFQNLVGNALKYRNNTPLKIEIGCMEQDHQWQFYVKDNGIGIEPKFFEKIFAVFQRLHSRKEFEGTGIGLSICKKIIQKHGGNIWLTSVPGEGSTFYFTIPKMIS